MGQVIVVSQRSSRGYRSLGEAIGAASDGSLIIVEAGQYADQPLPVTTQVGP